MRQGVTGAPFYHVMQRWLAETASRVAAQVAQPGMTRVGGAHQAPGVP